MAALETSRFTVIKITVAILICALIGAKVLARITSAVEAQTSYQDGLYHQGTSRVSLLARLRESASEDH